METELFGTTLPVGLADELQNILVVIDTYMANGSVTHEDLRETGEISLPVSLSYIDVQRQLCIKKAAVDNATNRP